MFIGKYYKDRVRILDNMGYGYRWADGIAIDPQTGVPSGIVEEQAEKIY